MDVKKFLLAASFAGFALGTVLAPSGAYAAHAGDPYGNVDHSNDKGNDTGDSRVDGLNAGQSNQNYRGPLEVRPPAQTQTMVPSQPPPPPPPPGAPVTIVR
jgi:hypothetical protein